MQPFLALITPLSGGHPDQGLPPVPPGIWPSPGYPAHPIAPGGPPPGIWPSPGYPAHPIVLPPGSISGTPEHPIYTPPMPPGHPSHPIVLPPNTIGGTPEHPIYYPPVGGSPPGIWGGPPAYPDIGGPPPQPGIWPTPPGGQPVPPEVWPQPPVPPLPPELESSVIVAVHKPGQDWEVKSYPIAPDQGQPAPTPHA
jgi:hypothetical protein